MNQLDLFYWAYNQYKKEFENNRDDYLFKKGVNSKKAPKDFVSMKTVNCEIDDDWIEAIEKGLEYIQKAIKEDRQFIRNEGEVLPIEKVRRVNKDSVSDLSKHSNYITRLPEDGKDVIPEKLLMSKRENDYSIYENRVVYTTLSYLKDFVSERLEKIKDAVNKYDGQAEIIKTIELGYRTVDVTFKVHDIRKNDELAMKRVNAQDKIQRLDTILNGVLVLLKTPLMQEVSKTPLVTRPVTKTNVLKMNTNFKESLAVFDYVCAYNKPGFEIKEEVFEIKPLSVEQENSYTDVILLYSFLTYMYNNKIEKELEKNYQKELKRREQLQIDEMLAKIKEMASKAKNNEQTLAEYAAVLEEGLKALEKQTEELKLELEDTIKEYEEKIQQLNDEHYQAIVQLNEEHQEEIYKLNEEHANELQELENNLRSQFAQEKEELITAYNAEIATRDEKIKELSESNESLTREVEALNKKIESLEAEVNLAFGENVALRADKKEIDPRDYTAKERIDQLEKASIAFKEFFAKSWKFTKKEIKTRYFSTIKEEVRREKEGGKKQCEVVTDTNEEENEANK